MLLRLYCHSRYIPDQDIESRRRTIMQGYNQGFHLVLYLLWLLEERGINTEIIDTYKLSEEELKEVYNSIFPLSIKKKYGIRRVFGTKHESGKRFGVEVPALLVYDGGMSLTDVYPRKPYELRPHLSYPKTIVHFLFDLLNKVNGFPKEQMGRITGEQRLKRRAER